MRRRGLLAAGLGVAVFAAACSSTVAGRPTPAAVPGTTGAPSTGSTDASTSPSRTPSRSSTAPSTAASTPASTAPREPDGAVGTVGDDGIGDPYYP